jgi:hypothetical protein
MARLPTFQDLGRMPSARSGRIIANFDTSRSANALVDLAKAEAVKGDLQSAALLEKARSLEGMKDLGRALQSIDLDFGGGSRGGGGGPLASSQAQRFETNRRYLEFVSSQERAMQANTQSVEPGAFGFREATQQNYTKAAKEFFASIPDDLKPEYDMKLFQAEDAIFQNAYKFEQAERTRYYGEEINKGLSTLENNLSANPGDFDKNYQEGVDYIKSIPDESVSRVDKAVMITQWRKKAQVASLSGVSPQERIRLLGGAPNPVDQEPSGARAQNMTRGMSGDIRKIVSDAAIRHGVDPNALLIVAWLESRGNPNAKNPNSSAGGLFQQIDSNAHDYGVANRFDPNQSADGAARFMRDNVQALERVLGRLPTAGELYLAHQQGAGGAIKLLTNPNAKAVDLVGSEAVRLNGGRLDMTAGEFAMLWTKKAGDTHVPDGGFMAAQYDPAKADPRYADMGYEEAQKIIRTAQVEIDSSLTLVDKARTEQAAATKVQYDQHKGTLELGIETGTINSELEILNDPVLTDAHKADLLATFKTKNEDRILAEKALSALQGGTLRVDAYDPKDRKTIDTMYDQLLQVAEPEDVQATTEEIVRQTGVVPTKAVNMLRRGLESTDVGEVQMAAQAAQRLSTVDPSALGRRDGGKEVQEAADDFGYYVNRMNLTPEEAAQRIMEARNPEKRRDRKVLEPLANEFVKQLAEEDLAGDLDAGQLGFSPAQAAGIQAEFLDIARDEFYRANGDPEIAKNRAIESMKRLYGVTELTGSPVLMKHPPERYWPAHREVGLAYAGIQLRQDLGEAFPEIGYMGVDLSKVQLVTTPETDAMVKAGEMPAYGVLFTDPNGVIQTLPGKLWKPDPTKMLEAEAIRQAEEQAAREAAARAAQPELKRRAEDTDTTRKFLEGDVPLDDAVRRMEESEDRMAPAGPVLEKPLTAPPPPDLPEEGANRPPAEIPAMGEQPNNTRFLGKPGPRPNPTLIPPPKKTKVSPRGRIPGSN